MAKRLLFIVGTAAFFWIGIYAHSLCAQKENIPADDEPLLTRIDSKLEELARNTKENKEIMRKIDRILSNQEKIINELGIIKVRSSLR